MINQKLEQIRAGKEYVSIIENIKLEYIFRILIDDIITIEEAHKFLNPEVASQTIFGTIAREMRKYNCTLLVIDQRPSGIDPEVMSQLGTKITCLLDNEKDIDSVLAGISGKNELKGVLAKLASKQQALIFGHAVPMPVSTRMLRPLPEISSRRATSLMRFSVSAGTTFSHRGFGTTPNMAPPSRKNS